MPEYNGNCEICGTKIHKGKLTQGRDSKYYCSRCLMDKNAEVESTDILIRRRAELIQQLEDIEKELEKQQTVQGDDPIPRPSTSGVPIKKEEEKDPATKSIEKSGDHLEALYEEHVKAKDKHLQDSQQSITVYEGLMSWDERINNYVKVTGYPRSLFVGEDERVVGTWIMGNNYRVKSTYYGGYPAGYLKRIKALFPDKKNILHLFSGKVDTEMFPGKTVDLNPELSPDYVDDAQTLENVPLEEFDLILADPPYSVEDAEHYDTPMVKRNKVMKALGSRLTPGTHVVWLDQVLPMYRKDQFSIEAVIGMVKSTNHRFRVIVIFKSNETPPQLQKTLTNGEKTDEGTYKKRKKKQ